METEEHTYFICMLRSIPFHPNTNLSLWYFILSGNELSRQSLNQESTLILRVWYYVALSIPLASLLNGLTGVV